MALSAMSILPFQSRKCSLSLKFEFSSYCCHDAFATSVRELCHFMHMSIATFFTLLKMGSDIYFSH